LQPEPVRNRPANSGYTLPWTVVAG